MKEVIRFILTVIFGVLYRVEIINKGNVPPTGAAILCSNHIAELDMFFIGYKIKRLVRWMAKEELFKIPIVAPLIRWLGAFPVKRGKGDVGAIKTALRLLNDGHIVGVFPEGTRVGRKDRSTVKAKPGAVMLAIEIGVPILPVAVKATYKPFSKVKIIFGKPYYLDIDRQKKYSNDELRGISQNIMNNIYEILEEN